MVRNGKLGLFAFNQPTACSPPRLCRPKSRVYEVYDIYIHMVGYFQGGFFLAEIFQFLKLDFNHNEHCNP